MQGRGVCTRRDGPREAPLCGLSHGGGTDGRGGRRGSAGQRKAADWDGSANRQQPENATERRAPRPHSGFLLETSLTPVLGYLGLLRILPVQRPRNDVIAGMHSHSERGACGARSTAGPSEGGRRRPDEAFRAQAVHVRGEAGTGGDLGERRWEGEGIDS